MVSDPSLLVGDGVKVAVLGEAVGNISISITWNVSYQASEGKQTMELDSLNHLRGL